MRNYIWVVWAKNEDGECVAIAVRTTRDRARTVQRSYRRLFETTYVERYFKVNK